jgi:regulator of CtrA degradation
MTLPSQDAAVVKPIMVDQLYNQATAIADESRRYFSGHSKTDRAALGAIDRVLYTAESLRISTRLMHVISWVMIRKAVANGEMSLEESLSARHRLDDIELCRGSDPRDLRKLPRSVIILSHQSLKIYQRALRLQDSLLDQLDAQGAPSQSPVANMLKDLEMAI